MFPEPLVDSVSFVFDGSLPLYTIGAKGTFLCRLRQCRHSPFAPATSLRWKTQIAAAIKTAV